MISEINNGLAHHNFTHVILFCNFPVHVFVSPAEALSVLDTPTVVGIAFTAFVIGALLTGALWFIYSHTGRCLTCCSAAPAHLAALMKR